MKYEVGQKVRILPNPEHKDSENNEWSWEPSMDNYVGREAIITANLYDGYELDCDKTIGWAEEWLEEV